AKIHRFCHEIYNIPITWLVDHKSMLLRQDMLKEYMEKYNDEVAILEWGMFTENVKDAEIFQPWVESAGIIRPKDFVFNDELQTSVGFHNMETEDIEKAIKFFAEDYRRVFGCDMKTFGNAFVDWRTVKAMKEAGIKNIWGYNWNYFCEGINNKGCPPGPFYIGEKNHNVPGNSEDCIIGVHWGAASHLIQYETDKFCRQGGAGHCLNVLELANRSYGLDKIDFHKKVIREYAENAKWNPVVHIPLQIEAIWIDEGKTPEELGVYCQYPTFNPGNTEAYYTELEESMAVGAKGVTISDLCDYMRENVPCDHKYIFFSEDIAPDLRHKGKDAPWDTFLVYKDNKRQYWFLKDRKFNYIRKYDYVEDNRTDLNFFGEYPFEEEPSVALKSKSMLCPTAGISLTDETACYELRDFSLTAKKEYKDYASVIWQANIPSYISDSEIETGGFVKDFVSVRDKNAVLLFGDLKEGLNDCIFRSGKPKDFIKIVRKELVGTRYEIWIENKGEETSLVSLETQILPGLALGGYWWNGEYNHTLYRFGWNDYNQKTGKFKIMSFYPVSF
ncbi:MAG: hypothetical protein KBT47_08610, partial [Armatimonadetes bacterium]|nr:hypothetical protein [Candidatus Hippobium faecium]